ERDQLLMQRRTDSGAWGVPGGGTDPGEDTETTARWNVTVAYLTRYFHGEVLPRDGEGLEVRFFELEALPKDTAPPIKPILSRLVEAHRAGLLPR
ncbi:MAG: NUDIX domain-containing protein, partial [Bacillota bacterium]